MFANAFAFFSLLVSGSVALAQDCGKGAHWTEVQPNGGNVTAACADWATACTSVCSGATSSCSQAYVEGSFVSVYGYCDCDGTNEYSAVVSNLGWVGATCDDECTCSLGS